MTAIYFDHAASTPVHPEVLQAMINVYSDKMGNPSGLHRFGRQARQVVSSARERIAAMLGCHANELVFTSGGTESDNMAVIGAAEAGRQLGKTHIITSAVEHHAVLHACEALERKGFRLTVLPVDTFGRVSPEDVQAAMDKDTALISIMYANNETGTIQPIEEIGRIARERDVLFHVDAVQAFGSQAIDLKTLSVDLMSFSAHKINGPQGVGALYICRNTRVEPLFFGGSQERKRRPGTENVAAIAGFAKAAEIAVNHLEQKKLFLDELRHKWVERMCSIADVTVNGHPEDRVPHIVNLSFLGMDTETLLMNLDIAGIAASGGSACTSGSLERSHVLKAMQLPEERMVSAVRFSFGLGNTLEEIETASKKVETFMSRIRTKA
jgi:cysteine desulfurase